MLGELASNKKLLKNNAESIVTAIKDMANFSGITIKKPASFMEFQKIGIIHKNRK